MRIAVPLVVTGCVAVVHACAGFDEAPDDSVADSGTIDGDGTGGGDAASDGAQVDSGPDATVELGAVAPNCPRPPGPTCAAIGNCKREALYVPATAGVEFPWGIASDSKFVYWTTMSVELVGDDPYNGSGSSKIMRIEHAGEGGGAKASTLVEKQRRNVAVAIAGEYLYWASMVGSNSELRRVRRDCVAPCSPETVVPLGAGHVQELVGIDGKTLAAKNDANDVKMIAIVANPVSPPTAKNAGTYGAVTASSTAAFVTGGFSPEVSRIPIGGGATTIGMVPDAGADSGLATGLTPSATDCRFVYGGRGRGQIWKFPVDGGTASYLGTTASNFPTFSLAADQRFVYAGAANGFGIYAVAVDGGAASFIQSGNIHRVAVGEEGVYWGDHERNTGGAIWVLRK